jgi:probable HAF family extracellular repeat protein
MAFPPTAPWWSAGLDNAAGQWRAFRWTASGGMRNLGTLGGRYRLAGLLMFPPTAPWWSARLKTPQGRGVPFAGRRLVACKTSARWAAMRARLMLFPPTAPWWSAGLQRRRAVACLSLDGFWWDARPRHAGRHWSGLLMFPPTAPWWSAGLATPQGMRRAFRWTASGGMQTSARCRAAVRARLMVFPPTAPWWSAGLKTPQGSGVPFAGRMVSCKTSARWAAMELAWGVSADGSVVVGWAENAARQWRAFRWTASGGMEDLNTTYASLLTDGSVLVRSKSPSPPMGAILWERATTPPQGATKPSCWIRRPRCTAHNGDVDDNGCVDVTPTCWQCCSPSGRRAATSGV